MKYFVETILRCDDKKLKAYLNHMGEEEGLDLVSITGFNRPVNENFQDYHCIWKHAERRKKKDEPFREAKPDKILKGNYSVK